MARVKAWPADIAEITISADGRHLSLNSWISRGLVKATVRLSKCNSHMTDSVLDLTDGLAAIYHIDFFSLAGRYFTSCMTTNILKKLILKYFCLRN